MPYTWQNRVMHTKFLFKKPEGKRSLGRPAISRY
jgi:hypothetical protein